MSEAAVSEAPRGESGFMPYVAPYFGFLLIVQLQSPGWLDGSLVLRILQVLVPAGLLLHYARGGAYPELRGFRPSLSGVAGDVGLGLAIAALWIVPVEAGWIGRPEGKAFDPDQFGGELRGLVLGLRLTGFALVTPFMEELFVRSFLIRAAEAVSISRKGLDIDFDLDFRDVPMARFAWRGFLVTVGFFAFSHLNWQWPAAFVTGIVWNLWLYHRGHLMALVISHATANLAIFLAVIYGPRLLPGGGSALDLWYQL